MVSASGKKAIITTVAHGGAKLKYYAGMTKSKIDYRDEFLSTLLKDNWDYVVLQEHSNAPYFRYEEDMVSAVQWLREKINSVRPKAKILLYMTHGYDYAYKDETGKKITLSSYDMVRYVGAAYTRLGQSMGMEVVPVGIHFYRASIIYPQIRLIGKDNKHPTKAGYFLAASCIYQKIFGEKPLLKKAVYTGAGISKKKGTQLLELIDRGIESDLVERTMQVGDSVTMEVYSLNGENLSGLRFTSLDKTVAQVGRKNGKIKAVGRGQAVIVAETEDGQMAFCTIYVAYNVPRNIKAEIHSNQVRNSNKAYVKTSWNVVEGAFYQVYRSSSKDSGYKLLATVKNSHYIDKTATLGHTWYYKIVATNGNPNCESKISKVVKVTALKVKNLEIKVTGKTRAKVTWKKNTKASGYMVYRSTSQNGTYKKVAEITKKNQNYYIDKERKKKRTYYYRVIAFQK